MPFALQVGGNETVGMGWFAVVVDPDGIVRLYQTGYTVDGGLHVDGWTYDGKKRTALPVAPEPSPTPAKKR